jgi:hypothetical protein
MTAPKARALLFGLNYPGTPSQLQGCVNDVENMRAYLEGTCGVSCKVCVDGPDTTALGMMQNLYEIALQSHSEALKLVVVHYSGHGSYIADRDGDERDGRDECLVPSDYETAGVLPDDLLSRLFAGFNPLTRVVFVCDACHSGTMCDVKYSWQAATKCTVENMLCPIRARVLTLSGCLDNQTSADAFNVLGDGKFAGALTGCLLKVLAESPASLADVFALHTQLTAKLVAGGFPQRPLLCSTYNLARARVFL